MIATRSGCNCYSLELRRDLNAAEHAELARLYDDGSISQATRLQLQRGLDLEAARLIEPR